MPESLPVFPIVSTYEEDPGGGAFLYVGTARVVPLLDGDRLYMVHEDGSVAAKLFNVPYYWREITEERGGQAFRLLMNEIKQRKKGTSLSQRIANESVLVALGGAPTALLRVRHHSVALLWASSSRAAQQAARFVVWDRSSF